MKIIPLDTKHTTYQMGVTEQGFLLHLYYGSKVDCDMDYLLTYYDRGFSGNPGDVDDRTFSLDALPQEYPSCGAGDFRSPSLAVRGADGTPGCDLRYKTHRWLDGKYAIPGLPAVYADQTAARTLEVVLADPVAGVEVTLKYGVLPELDVITRCAVIKNTGSREIILDKAASVNLDFLCGGYDLIHFTGRHGMERMPQRVKLGPGSLTQGSRRGTSSHQQNPFVILADHSATEDAGACWGISLLYSGNFSGEAAVDQFSQTRLTLGLREWGFDYPLAPGESLATPEAAMAYTAEGLTALSQIYHRLIRRHVCRGKYRDIRRPILINNWEATYFDFTGDKIVDIARQAAELGVEMLVLDDGWFGRRDDDCAGLGDWKVNEAKLGGPLKDVVDRVNDLGMAFGLWIEPEMVSEDSDLYRAHPDWAFTVPGRQPVRGRSQLVLDFSRPEVVDGVFNQIAAVIDQANIKYIKMDMNRSITDVYSSGQARQHYGKTMHRYVLGVYDFLERLITRYPDMLIEGCSGGGGRFDAGMLYYTPQIWCSDNTDAIERIRIQHGTSFGYPIQTMGAHVSAVPNHQTGRTTPIGTRATVAMAGTFGYELDLSLITEEEKEAVKNQIATYKRYWHLIADGRYYRLHEPGRDTEMAAWNFAAADGSEALLSAVSLDTHCNGPVTYVPCKGLVPDARYDLTPVEGSAPGAKAYKKISGAALMETGIPMPLIPGEYNAWSWAVVRR